MKFGLELEAGFKEADLKSAIFNFFLKRNKAIIKSDGSLRMYNENTTPREINTRPYLIPEEKKKLFNFLKKVYPHFKEINESCGLHVHISGENGDLNALCSKKFTNFFINQLKKEYKYKPVLLERLTNKYCKNYYPTDYFKNMSFNKRYKAINWCCFGQNKTFEIRVFDMPKTYSEAENYINFTEKTINTYLSKHAYNIAVEQPLIEPEPKKTITITGLKVECDSCV